MMKVVVCSLLLIYLSTEIVTSTDVYVKNGSEAVLPCELADDSVRWYGIGDHQYSSGKNILKSLPLSLQERLHIIDRDGYNLGIFLVQKEDEGTYKCISDNETIYDNLHLIVAPNSISFTGSSDEHIITADENKEFKVICKVDGGYPPPNLQLFWNRTLVMISESRTLIYAINLTRADDFTNVTCIANHSELYNPLEIQSVIHLNLAPTQLTMMDLPAMFEGQLVNISCLSVGSRPQASFEWTSDGIIIANSSVDESEIIYPFKTYRIKSTLSVEFDRTQNRKLLACRTFNLADSEGIRQSQMMEIYYPPSIDISYQNTTEDAETRIFSCKPHGNPAVYDFFPWEHLSIYNEFIRYVKGNEKGQVILPISKSEERYQDSGIYKCLAQNEIADRQGNKIQNGSVTFISEGSPAAPSENVYSNKRKLAEDTTLNIKFVSKPAPLEIFWFKIDDGRNILINNSMKYTQFTTTAIIKDLFHGRTIHTDGYITSLYIRKLKVNDFTKYRCEIHNTLGNMSLIVQIKQNTDFEPDAKLQTTGIVLTSIGGLLIVLHVALIVYKRRRNKSENPAENIDSVEWNHHHHRVGHTTFNMVRMNHDLDTILPFEDVKDPVDRAPDPLPDERYSPDNESTSKTGNNFDGSQYEEPDASEEFHSLETSFKIPNRIEIDERPVPSITFVSDSTPTEPPLMGPQPTPVSRKPIPPSPKSPPPPPPPPIEENTSIDVEYRKPNKIKRGSPTSPLPNFITGNQPTNTVDSICNNVECPEPILMSDVISTGKKPGVTRKLLPAISNTLPPAEDGDLSSGIGYSSFSGPNTMDQRQMIPSSMRHLSQDILEEEDRSKFSSDEEKEDEAMSMHNPSYQEKEGETNAIDKPYDQEDEDEMYHDARSGSNDVISVSSENVHSKEAKKSEELHPPSTNTEKKKPLQYYPTFPKVDDGTWKEPAEPIKVLDESQEETHKMELDKSLNDHNDEEKRDSTSTEEDRQTEC